MNPITLNCKTCRKMLLYSSDTARLRQYAKYHHATNPGHWIQAEIENDITHQTHIIDVPNRDIPQENIR